MRIPLDYYRILGLPIQASYEQLQQAYRDRILQLPRREYSSAAIAARKQLLEEAYAVLSDPEQRSSYDASYFAHTYERSADHPAEPTPEVRLLVPDAVEPHTPSIEISDEQFVGALLILLELGEYELVLNLGRPYFSISSVAFESGQKSGRDQVLSDILLTVALACLELAREQWQQGQYENAASSLETGQTLLLREGLFGRVCAEIEADLYKLRPYRILELLACSEDNVAERRFGLKLLQDILQERGGIDGTGDDGSGLGLDDFLRFIQQLRSYLTAAEQQSLFEAESQRPSAVATYLAVYALIARGFAERLPVLIRKAKLLLIRLGKRQDLYLEQAVCSLLLGQTEAASDALKLSQETEPLKFIQEHSQGSPDLLPGLCLYTKRWLQTEVFPHFRDLAQQQVSLNVYFADRQVQAYLEALPKEVEATNEIPVVTPKSLAYAQATRLRHSPLATSSSQSITATLTATPDKGVAMVPGAEPLARGAASQNHTASPDATALTQVRPSGQRSRRRKRSRVGRGLGAHETGKTRFPRQVSSLLEAIGNVLKPKKTRLVFLGVSGVLGIVCLGFLVSQSDGRSRQTLSPTPTPSLQGEQPLVPLKQGEQPMVQVAQPPLPIPKPRSELLAAQKLLTQETAQKVIQTWLSTKAAAFGSNHAVDKLKQILVAPTLFQWQQMGQKDKADNRYRQYKHSLKVNSVRTSKAASGQAQVEATVHEVAQVYEKGKLNQNSSYDQNLRVRYDLVRQNGQWRIRDMKVLR